MRLISLLAIAICVLGGCGTSRQSVPLAPVHAPIPSGQSRVIIARKSNLIIAQGRHMEVRRNGQTVGTLAPDGFLAWDQPPGNINLDIEGRALPLTLESDKATCVETSVDFGGIQFRFIDFNNYQQFISVYTTSK